MAARLSMIVRAFVVSCLINAAFPKSFPSIDEMEVASYSTEVQLSLVKEAATVYVKEYYNNIDDRGSLSIYMQGYLQSIYYDNSSNEVLDVNKTHCKATEVDISEYSYTPLYHGWLSTNPLVIGPSAPLSYAQKHRDDIVDAGTETVRDIPCDKWELAVNNKVDNYTIQFYFAPEDWTTPYKYKSLRIPIRISIIGVSSRFTGDTGVFTDVNQTSDFAYFKPSIDDLNDLLPPIGIGCKFRQKSDSMPSIPDKFKFKAELVNLKQLTDQEDVEVQFESVAYDYRSRLSRLDRYTKKKGYRSALYDYKGGAAYYRLNDGSCQISSLRDTEFITYDLGMVGRMMTPKEALLLNGDFYEMGKREIRGIRCDTYESVVYDVFFMTNKYYKFVVTAYFIEGVTIVGVDGEMESQIPAYIIVNGWSTPYNRTLTMQYNIFAFNDVIWPEMYSSFGIERCYAKPETKAYFVLVLEVQAKDAAAMEDQDEMIISQLREEIARHAKVPKLRIPYLKADYKTTGVFVTGVLLERPPALIEFYQLDSGPVTTKDPDLKVIPDAETLEECSYACIDESDYPCKGFYFCNRACFLKSTDPFEQEEGQKETDLGVCDEYMRAERESTTFREAYLAEALENLETAVLNESLPVKFEVPDIEELVYVRDIVVGDGPYTGVDTGDKPFTLSIEWRKLDPGLDTTQTADYAQTLTDCYKLCKEAGSACSSFSFCPDTPKDDKQCLISSELAVKGITSDTDLLPDKYCNIYNPKYSDYFEPYPEKISLLAGDKSIRSVPSLEKCAQNCRLEKDFVCRGFEYCRSMKTCTLHKTHILDLKSGESGGSIGNKCVHYAARFIADYMDLGPVLLEDESNVRYGTSLEECAKICSEEMKEDCNSFNYCPTIDFTDSTCALSKKLLRDDGVTTTEKKKCLHYEKRDVVHDWDKKRTQQISTDGYTKKGFTGLVVGMLALGLIIGALAFVGYSYIRSRSSNEGMSVRFMKNET